LKHYQINNPKLTPREIRQIIAEGDYTFTTRTTASALLDLVQKMHILSDLNFRVYCASGGANLELRNGDIYFNIDDINHPVVYRLFNFADRHKVRIINYNVDMEEVNYELREFFKSCMGRTPRRTRKRKESRK
jgi:hypothetical protein